MNAIYCMEDIFRGRLFRVPDYQRGYTWEKKNWDDLIQDLELLPEGRTHFTGTLVLRQANNGASRFRDEHGATYALFDVIDGQQRLTTVVLLLDAIHDEMDRLKMQNLSTGLEKAYLTVKDLAGQPHTRLTLNRDCQEFFYNNVLGFNQGIGGPQIRSHRLLLEAHKQFDAYLAKQREERKVGYSEWLTGLYFKVTQNLRVLLYEVESDMDAGVIFETMNDRGRPLTELEKVKNYLLYIASKLDLPAPHDLAEQVNSAWIHIFEELMSSGLGDTENEDQLLRMHWLMAYDYNPKNWENSRSIKKLFNLRGYQGKHPALLAEVIEYLSSLKNACTAYCDIRCPKRAGAFNDIGDTRLRTETIDISEKLVRLGARVNFIPLLMAVRLKAKDGGAAYRQAVELCEKVDFRLYQWMRYRSFAAQSTFFRIGYDFYQRPDLTRLVTAITRTAHNYCSNEQFAERFERTTENWYDWGGLKYFLYEHEQHLAQAEHKRPHYLWEDLIGADLKRDTIEHILPQTLKDPYWKRRFTPKKHQRWVHDIGNLTLTYDNSSLGAKSFPNKKGTPQEKNCYASSKLFIEHELVKCTDWVESQILERRERIRTWAVKRWYIEAPAVIEMDEDESGEARLLRLAEENGTLEEFQALLQAIRQLKIYPRMQRNWRVVLCALPQNKLKALFWIGPDLYVQFNPPVFEEYFQISRGRLSELIGEVGARTLDSEEVDEFIAGLNHLFESVMPVGKVG